MRTPSRKNPFFPKSIFKFHSFKKNFTSYQKIKFKNKSLLDNKPKDYYKPLGFNLLTAIAVAATFYFYNKNKDAFDDEDTINFKKLSKLFKDSKKFNEIMITQNSGLFSIYENTFFQSAGISQETLEGKTLIFLDKFWLESVDESRLDTKWGQIKHEFPPSVRKIILKKYPDLKDDDRLTFKQFLAVRAEIINFFKHSPNHIIVNSHVDSISYSEIMTQILGSWLDPDNPIVLFDYQPEDALTFNGQYTVRCSHDTVVYNTTRVPRSDKLITSQNDGNDLPPQTEIYRYEKGKAPQNLIIFGSGLSAIWIKEQAPGSNIIFVFKDRSVQPPDIKRNASTKIAPTEIVYPDECDFLLSRVLLNDNSTNPLIINRKEALNSALAGTNTDDLPKNHLIIFKKGTNEIIFSGEAYAAGGFSPRDIKSNLPNGMLINIHIKKKIYAPKNLPSGALFDNYNSQIERISKTKAESKILLVNFQELFIRESDIPLLARAFETNVAIITKICNKISELEDTPENTRQFWKESYKELDGENPEKFNKKVDYLYNNKEKIFSDKKSRHTYKLFKLPADSNTPGLGENTNQLNTKLKK